MGPATAELAGGALADGGDVDVMVDSAGVIVLPSNASDRMCALQVAQHRERVSAP